MPKTNSPSEFEVTVDRRRKERRTTAQAGVESSTESVKPKNTGFKTQNTTDAGPAKEFKEPRRRKERRRQIDPTTCERDYNVDEIDFMQAFDAYKRSSGRMFPTCSEILEVVRSLGYTKLTDEERELLASLEEVEEVETELVNI